MSGTKCHNGGSIAWQLCGVYAVEEKRGAFILFLSTKTNCKN